MTLISLLCWPLKGIDNEMDNEFLRIIEKLVLSGNGFAVVLWAAYLLKRYVINGNAAKFWSAKEREILALSTLIEKLETVIDLQRELNTHAKGEGDGKP